MRLITRKLHRAFPELDRFSDEQCGRFIKATGRSWRRVPHLLAVFLTYMVTGLVAGCVVTLTARGMGVDLARVDPPVYVALPLVLLGAVLCAVPAFIVRDRLLRARVRRVLVARSHCVHCRYSLLGMPVGEDCVVICPECATPTEVDPSLCELETGATGERRFVPRSSGAGGAWLDERHRRAVKRAALVCALVFLVALPGSWGLYEWWLSRQAATAASQRPQPEQFMALVEERQPPGAVEGTPNAWEMFSKAQLRMMDVDAAAGMPKDSTGQEVYPDFTLIYSPRVVELDGEDDTLGRQRQEQDRVAEAAARERIEKYRAAGVFELMDEMAARPRAVRPLHMPVDQPAVQVLLTDLGQARNMARMNAGRMAAALESGGGGAAEWLRAFEANLAVARMDRQQPFLLDQLVSVAISALTYERLREFLKTHPDGPTLERVLEIMDRQASPLDVKRILEGERLASLNTVGWVFTQKKMVRLGRFSKGSTLMFGETSGRLGTWAENRDALNRYFDEAAAHLSTPLRDRQEQDPGPTGLRYVDLMVPALDSAARSFDLVLMEEVGVRTMVALERFYAAQPAGAKRYPATVKELVPAYLAEVPIDPWDGQALKYRVHAAGQERNGWGYTLYSVGGDGEDAGGRAIGKEHRHTQFSKVPTRPRGAEGGFDFVINE